MGSPGPGTYIITNTTKGKGISFKTSKKKDFYLAEKSSVPGPG